MKRRSRIFLLALVLGFLHPGLQANPLSRKEIEDLYSQAKQFFTEANDLHRDDETAATDLYRRSLLYYERIVNEGDLRNGKIFYNIANIHMRLGDLGRAVLNYRRALRYMPRDINLLRNLDYARSLRIDSIESGNRAEIARILLFWHFDLSSRVKVILFSISFILIWLSACLGKILGRSGLTWAAFVFVIPSLLLSGSLILESVEAQRNPAGVILASELRGRKGNSETYQESFAEPLHAGTEFVVREDRGDWILVELADGRETWLPADGVGMLGF